jgi:hypothetical protein
MPPEAAPLLAELREHKPEALAVLEAGRDVWPEESSDCQRRFGREHARLFPFLGRHVQHRSGEWGGRLVQVLGALEDPELEGGTHAIGARDGTPGAGP